MAGPPFRTDDPGPVDYCCWEFYGAAQIIHNNEGFSGVAPYGEVNYGIVPGIHVHLNVPVQFYRPIGGDDEYGPGDVEFGFKCRLVSETTACPLIGIYPVVEIPTGNAARHLGEGEAQFFLPLWLQKSLGPWTTYCGGGYLVNNKFTSENSWFIGWAAQRDLSEIMTFGAEIFSLLYPSESAENELACNIGTIVNFSEKHHFLFSMGRDIIGANDLLLYAAYQLTIGNRP
jgi:hypothetical protein